MSEFIPPLEMMIEAFRRLPGVGRKSAERMAFGVLDMTEEETDGFVRVVMERISREFGEFFSDLRAKLTSDSQTECEFMVQ